MVQEDKEKIFILLVQNSLRQWHTKEVVWQTKDLILYQTALPTYYRPKQSILMKETDTLPGVGVVVVVTAKYKYVCLEKLR